MAATTDRDRCPPAPPPKISVALHTELLAPDPDDFVRLHWRGNPPLGFSIAKRGNRFDPLGTPWQTTRVLYAGTTLEVAIAETILRWHGQVKGPVELSNETQLRDRQVARFRPSGELTVINATGLGLNPVQRAVDETIALPQHASAWVSKPAPLADDIFQCPHTEYATTQAWGAWFRSQCPDADGIQWISRQFNVGRCLVLFEDRCGAELTQTGRSADLIAPGSPEEQTLDELLAQIGWTRS
jgi:RES domain